MLYNGDDVPTQSYNYDGLFINTNISPRLKDDFNYRYYDYHWYSSNNIQRPPRQNVWVQLPEGMKCDGGCEEYQPYNDSVLYTGNGNQIGGAYMPSTNIKNNNTPPPTDTTPPTTTWSNPPNGTTIRSQTVTLRANASDDSSGINRVSFSAKYGDSWHAVNTDSTAPYEYNWDLCGVGVPDGDIELGLEAWDNAGNSYVYSQHFTNYHINKEYICGSSGGGSWQASYFNTRTCWDDHNNCNGQTHTENLSVPGGTTLLDKNWGTSSPGGSIGADNWTGRFKASINFSPGYYVFYADHDDGLKLKIGGYGEHEKSSSGSGSQICNGSGGYYLSGSTPLEIYLREDGGDAKVKLWWGTNTSVCGSGSGGVSGGSWSASYFNTRTCWDDHNNCNGQTYNQSISFSGGDTLIDRNWGQNSPGGGIGSDNWTGRFEGTFNFQPGRYVFYADHDDGLKLKFGNYGEHNKDSSGSNSIICDDYSDGYYLSGNVPIKLYLREDGGDARLRLRWGTNTSDCIPVPPAPAGVTATDGAFTDRVQIRWNAASHATGYEVWRGAGNNSGSATQIAASVSSTGYDDTNVTPGQTYYYWVKAKNSKGTSGFSGSDSGYALIPVPAAPTGVLASDGTYSS